MVIIVKMQMLWSYCPMRPHVPLRVDAIVGFALETLFEQTDLGDLG